MTVLSSIVVVPPAESIVRLPDDVVTVLPSIVILSTSRDVSPLISVCEPPSAIVSEPIVIELLESFELAIEPAN